MAWSKPRSRVKSIMINVLVCYTVFTFTCVVTWIHLQTQTARKYSTQQFSLASMSESKPEPGIVNQTTVSKLDIRQRAEQQEKQQEKEQNGPPAEQTKPEKCTNTIASLTKYSKWFRDRFKPETRIFLDSSDLKNFRRFSNRTLPDGFKGINLKLMNDILRHKNFINPPVHGPTRKSGCISCAVVGSGGILKGSGAGVEIDHHDYIFRVNRAESGKFYKDVGSRTTFYTFYPESQNISVPRNGVLSFYTMFKKYDVDYALRILNRENFTNKVNNIVKKGIKSSDIDPKTLKLVHPEFFYYITREFLAKEFRPTTGTLNIFLALHICDQVTVYGYGYDPKFSIHYYDKKFIKPQSSMTKPHNVEMERQIWFKLHDVGAIRLFKRDF